MRSDRAAMTLQTGANSASNRRRSIATTWWAVLLLSGLLLVGVVATPDTQFDPPLLLTTLNLLLQTGVPLFAAALAIPAYRRTGTATVLALGAGMLAIGIGSGVISAVLLFQQGEDASLTLHNTSLLIAGTCHFVAAVDGVFGVSLPRRRLRHIAIVYCMVAVSIGLVLAADLAGYTPAFWVDGPTFIRQAVLVVAMVLFGLSAFTWWQTAVRDRGIRFLAWYVPGLTLFALGIAGILAETVVGGLVSWIGRAGQYLGAAYMLVAVAGETVRFDLRRPSGMLGIALLQAALPFRPLVESTSDAVVALARDGRVVYWNDAARRLFGPDPDEAFDADPVELMAAGPDLEDSRGQLRALLKAPRDVVTGGRRVLVLGDRNGRRFSAEVAAFASPQDDRLLVCVITDISERIRAQEELEQRVHARTAELERTNEELEQANRDLARANAAKDEFLGLVSHELKTPITTILAASSVLARKLGQADPDGLAADISTDASRLAGIVDNLLALARLETGRTVETEPVALDRLLPRAVATVRREFPDRSITVAAESGVIVEANAEQLSMVIRNYLSNALKYSEPDTTVEVVLRVKGNDAIVSVIDSGVGVRTDEIGKLFDAFYRSPSTAVKPGIGIGLAVCRRVVESLGGGVGARRRADAEGSVFEFWLPIAPHDLELTGPDGSEPAAEARAEAAPTQAVR